VKNARSKTCREKVGNGHSNNNQDLEKEVKVINQKLKSCKAGKECNNGDSVLEERNHIATAECSVSTRITHSN